MKPLLKLIKEYIDAKANYERAGLHRQTGILTPSSSLTEAGQRIKDRYLAAEQALNDAIEEEDSRP